MSYETITLTKDARGVATLTLNRPERHNALSGQMIDEITAACGALSEAGAARALVFAGNGESFCAGGDLGWMQAQIAADGATRGREAGKLAFMLSALNRLPMPVIGRVQGPAYGGGVGMMSVCDVVVAADTARFGLTETRLGIIPATIGPYVVARLGEGMARRVFMSSRIFDAEEAVRLGLVAKVVSAEALDAAVEAEVAPYMNCAPGAVARAKALALKLSNSITEENIAHSIEQLVAAWEGEEAKEGIAAFFAKEKPSWAKR